MSLSYLKLVTGEEVMGEIVTETPETITLRNTVSIMLRPTNTETMNYAFLPWGPLCENKTVFKSFAVFIETPNDEAADAHRAMFSNIVTPASAKKILT